MNKYFYCYSYPLKEFLIKNGCRYDHVLIDEQFVLFFDTECFDYNKITVPFTSKIDVFDLDGNYIQTFISQSDASRNLGIDNSSISKCCLGKIGHVKDFIFKKHQNPLLM